MRNAIRTAALAAALICPLLPLSAATAGEFYASLLRRGVAAYDAGRMDEATQHLRLAAFGLIENIEQYQTAHAYLTSAYDRLGQQDRARDSVRRIAQAERVQARFATLKIPAPVRATVEKLANGVLTPSELSGLRGTAAMPPRQPAATPAVTTTITSSAPSNPPATVERVDVEEVKQPPAQTQAGTNHQQPATTTTTPKPATTTPTTTQPQTPRPATTQTSTTPATTTQTTTQPRVQPPAPAPATTTPPRPAPVYSAAEQEARFAAAERALTTSNLPEARRIYSELLAAQGLDRDAYIRLAEGFYRSRHFAGALAAFERAGGLRRGEEPYRYYVAVALYETGQYARAKTELTAALPYIEITPDVARYRAKIQSAIQ